MPDIPLSKIHANPKNPRRVITLEMIDNMAASLQAVGLKNPIKLNVLPDGSYELISGHIRFAGAQRLGWETIPAELLTLTPAEAELVGLIDNQSTQMHWLDWVLAMEKMNNGPDKLKQQQIADKLGVTQARVNYALKIAKALTPASRTLIYNSVIKLGPDKAISEVAVRALADLGDPQAVEKALPVALKRGMTKTQAKGLANHVKAGKHPEDYGKPNPALKAPQAGATSNHADKPESTTPEKPKTDTTQSDPYFDPKRPGDLLAMAIILIILWYLGTWAWKAVVWAVTTVIHWL